LRALLGATAGLHAKEPLWNDVLSAALSAACADSLGPALVPVPPDGVEAKATKWVGETLLLAALRDDGSGGGGGGGGRRAAGGSGSGAGTTALSGMLITYKPPSSPYVKVVPSTTSPAVAIRILTAVVELYTPPLATAGSPAVEPLPPPAALLLGDLLAAHASHLRRSLDATVLATAMRLAGVRRK